MWQKIKKLFYHQKVDEVKKNRNRLLTDQELELIRRFEKICVLEGIPTFLLEPTVGFYRVMFHSRNIQELLMIDSGALSRNESLISVSDWFNNQETHAYSLLKQILIRLKSGRYPSRFLVDVENLVRFFEEHL